MRFPDTAAVILSAGNSSRMKTHKALLPYNEGLTFLDKILNTYVSWGCSRIVVVAGEDLADQIRDAHPSISQASLSIAVNNHPEFERFYSVKLGVSDLTEASFCFIHNVDNPFTTASVLDHIWRMREEGDYISPVFESKGGHPVLLNRKSINFIRDYPSDQAVLRDVLSELNGLRTEINDERVLININTPEDYERHIALLQIS